MSTLEKATRLNELATNAFESTTLAKLKSKGLGPARCKKLAEAGIVDAIDLLAHLPKAYVDYSIAYPVASAPLNEAVHVRGRLLSLSESRTYGKNISVVEALLDDGDGSLVLRWYRRKDLMKKLEKGESYAFLGIIKPDRSGRVMTQPRLVKDLETPLGIAAIYADIAGLGSEALAAWITNLLEAYAASSDAPTALESTLPSLPARLASLRLIHQPQDLSRTQAMLDRQDPAFLRLVFDECLAFQTRLQQMARSRQVGDYPRLKHIARDWLQRFCAQLPFPLTRDQQRTLVTQAEALSKDQRLYGLVQGDVGCGKTVIGLALAYLFAHNGLQTALMAPTTVLADQHARTAQQLLAPLGIRVGALHGQLDPATQRDVIRNLAAGNLDFVVGTHRLFQRDVEFATLGLALIDEQHRFGVAQRAALLKKGRSPHYLAFSATPIPRGLALTVFGEVDLYQIREKPARRQSIRTILKKNANRTEVIDFVKRRLEKREAVFWVAPLIEESDEETSDLAAASVFQHFSEEVFPSTRIGLVHGRMDRDAIAETMAQLRSGDIQLLVATTVIEVGVDVPHATVMVVEGANRFGLSQLHQLRGRVGRSDKAGFCFLMLDETTRGDTLKRMRLLEHSDDGFEISEKDLEWRGAGELLGVRQSGCPQFRFCDLWQHRDVMAMARSQALDQLCSESSEE